MENMKVFVFYYCIHHHILVRYHTLNCICYWFPRTGRSVFPCCADLSQCTGEWAESHSGHCSLGCIQPEVGKWPWGPHSRPLCGMECWRPAGYEVEDWLIGAAAGSNPQLQLSQHCLGLSLAWNVPLQCRLAVLSLGLLAVLVGLFESLYLVMALPAHLVKAYWGDGYGCAPWVWHCDGTGPHNRSTYKVSRQCASECEPLSCQSGWKPGCNKCTWTYMCPHGSPCGASTHSGDRRICCRCHTWKVALLNMQSHAA